MVVKLIFAFISFWCSIFRFIFSPVLNLMDSKHKLPFAVSGREPPNPKQFPFFFQNKQDMWIHWTAWRDVPDRSKPKGVVFISHGYGEHVARYESIGVWLNENGYIAFAIDHQGHGASEGDRKYVEAFPDYCDDLQLFVKTVYERYPQLGKLPRFLLGHSMGGLISVVTTYRDAQYWDGVVLSGPAVKLDPDAASPLIIKIGRVVSKIFPKAPVSALNEDLVSRSPSIVEQAKQDALKDKGLVKARWAAEFIGAIDYVWNNTKLSNYKALLVLHATDDKLCDVEGSRRFVKEANTKNKKLVEFPGLYHEVLTENKNAPVLAELLSFLKANSK